MASYGVRITLPIPTSGQVQWDGPLGDLLQALIDVLSQRVTVDGLDVGATLDAQGHALVNALNVGFIANGDPGTANSLYYSGGELLCRDGSNRVVQLTSGGVVNVGGSGGFGGDYASSNQNGASFTNSTSTFTFTASGGTSYATMEHGTLKVHNGSSAQAVSVQSPSALGSSYALTLPTSLPTSGGPTLLRVDATGSMQLAASASFTEYIDVASAVSATPGSSGTANYQSGPTTGSINGWLVTSAGGECSVDIAVPYQLGDRIDSISFGSSGFPITGTLFHRSDIGLTAVIARACDNSGVALLRTLQNGTATMTGTLPFTPPGTGSLYLKLGTTNSLTFSTLKVTRLRKLIP